MLDEMDFSWLDDDTFGDGDALETARQLARPLTYERREAKRQFINGLKKEALNELIPTLPPPETDLYIVGNGAGAEIKHGISKAFDFGTFIPHIVAMLGDRECIAYISSWTMNENHVKAMIAMLDQGQLAALTVFTDPYFARRTPPIYAQLVTGLQKHPERGRYLSFKNHVKVIAISAPDGRTCTITGSANLSAQPRCEQYVLTTAPDVFAFFRDEFFVAMLHAKT